MKKVTAIILLISLFFTITGCKRIESEVTEQSTTTEESTEEVTDSTMDEYEEENSSDISNISWFGERTEPFIIDSDYDVEITLQGVIANLSEPIIQVENAKSVTIILLDSSSFKVTGTDVKAIESNVDITFTGSGTLNIEGEDTAIKSKSNLIFESGTYNIIASEEEKGIRADNTVTFNGGTFNIRAGECIEATYININGGEFNLSSPDDAINTSNKLDNETIVPSLTINGGTINIEMDAGDTDGIDSNGDITINNGIINITAQSAFDWDGNLEYNGGTVIVNGEEVDTIINQFGDGMMRPPFDSNDIGVPPSGDIKPEQPPNGRP